MNKKSIETVISENIKFLRKELGWSQEFLAEQTGVSAPYITQIESGKRTPSLEIVERLALAFDVEYKVLFEDGSAGKKRSLDHSKHFMESKLINAITDTIHKEFGKGD